MLPCYFYSTVASTMDTAKQVQKDGVGLFEDLFVVAARHQTQGRGRNGSTWKAEMADPNLSAAPLVRSEQSRTFIEVMASEKRILPFTLAVPRQRLQIPLHWLSLASGCAIIDAVERLVLHLSSFGYAFETERPCQMKWPNDIISKKNLKKISGILCETSVQGADFSWAYVGVGFNLWEAPGDLANAQSLWETCLEIMTSVPSSERDRMKRRWREDLAFQELLTKTFAEFLATEFIDYITTRRTSEQLRHLALERMVPVGTLLSVDKGTRVGIFSDLDEQGGLVLAGEQRPILSAELQILPKTLKENFSTDNQKVYNDGLFLILDVGNTRAHLTLFSGPEDVLHEIHVAIDHGLENPKNHVPDKLQPLCIILKSLKCPHVTIVVVSVNTSELTQTICDRVSSAIRWAAPGLILRSEIYHTDRLLRPYPQLHRPLVENYDGKLGVDRALRFLAMVRREMNKRVATFSLGTALTVEMVDEKGNPCANFILPGFAMSLKAMNMYGARLPRLDLSEGSPELLPQQEKNERVFGTAQAMHEGVRIAIASFIKRIVQLYEVEFAFFTGGDVEVIRSDLPTLLKIPYEIDASLEAKELMKQVKGLRRDHLTSASWPNTPTKFPQKSVDMPNSESLERPALGEHTERVLRSLRRVAKRKVTDKPIGELSEKDFRRLGSRIEGPAIGNRLDRYLAHRYRFHSRPVWRKRIQDGEVKIEFHAEKRQHAAGLPPLGEVLNVVKPTYALKEHDQLWVHRPESEEPGLLNDVTTVWDNGDIVVFNKPGNVVIHAVGMYGKNTFLDLLKHSGFGGAYPVHRIDRETSGLLLCARQAETRTQLTNYFKTSVIHKMYLAVTKGDEALEDVFYAREPIGPAVDSSIRLKLWVNTPEAVPALTLFKRLSSFGNYHLFACMPITGRTNQIRIHLACRGHWIVGDKMYHENEKVFLDFFENGVTRDNLGIIEFPRHILHNTCLSWPNNDSSQKPFVVCCPLTPDILEFSPVLELLKLADIPESQVEQKKALTSVFAELIELRLKDLKQPD